MVLNPNMIKKFKIKQSDFFEEHYARFDKLTSEKIPFKSIDKYFSSHFINKNNLKKYLKESPDAAIFAKQLLKERIELKQLHFALNEVELSSLSYPPIKYYQEKYGYNKLCNELGVISKYDYSQKTFSYKQDKLTIICDTREQKPLKFLGHNIINTRLNFGDYSVLGRENILAIERKSLQDLIGSAISGYERFYKEFQRVKDAGAYLVVVIEENLNTCLNYDLIPYIRKYSKISPGVLFHNIRELIQNFPCQFIFCAGRKDASETIIKLFNAEVDIRVCDLQYFKNMGLI